jgi:hypothetical protein
MGAFIELKTMNYQGDVKDVNEKAFRERFYRDLFIY